MWCKVVSKFSEKCSVEDCLDRGCVEIREGRRKRFAVVRGCVSLRKRGGRFWRRLKGLFGLGCLLRVGYSVAMTCFS